MTYHIRTILLRTICFWYSAVSLIAQESQTESLPLLNGKKVLVVYGGWKGHQPEAFKNRIVSWLNTSGARVTISDSLGAYTNKKLMSETDLIIQYWTMGTLSKEQQQGLLTAVKEGTGLAGCHGGLGDSFRNTTAYQYMVGGQWVAHPGGKIDYTVRITNTDDPITEGITDFNIRNTEQYYMHVDPNSRVLATTTFSDDYDSWIGGAILPVAWKKYFAKGRVFYLSIGHDPKDFDTPEAWKLLTRGIRWAGGSKYSAVENLVSPVYPPRMEANKSDDGR